MIKFWKRAFDGTAESGSNAEVHASLCPTVKTPTVLGWGFKLIDKHCTGYSSKPPLMLEQP